MLMYGKGFGEEVGQVQLTRDEADIELELADPVFDPVKAHVHALGFLGANGVAGNPTAHSLSQKIGVGG